MTREHPVANRAPDWSRPSQAFRHFDGTLPKPQPAAAERRRWGTQEQAYTAGVRTGFIGAMAFYAVGSLVLVLIFHFLGVQP